jgi:hypothetical protein
MIPQVRFGQPTSENEVEVIGDSFWTVINLHNEGWRVNGSAGQATTNTNQDSLRLT